jgi:hypothetical protein
MHSARKKYFYASFGLRKKKALFPFVALTELFLITETECVYCVVRNGSSTRVQVNFRL